jgi:NadR type nicotinamide-nucleotide adenylyltransferase
VIHGGLRAAGPARVVLTGSESTGKTMLARQLADHYGAELVPEFARDHAREKQAQGGESAIGYGDHEPIARGQMARETAAADAARQSGARLLVQDTDLLSTVVYCAHYYDRCPSWLTEAARARRPDLYLLLEVDVPWVADEVRDRGDRREEVQQLFRDAAAASGSPVVAISGSWNDRLRLAIAAVDRMLHER